MAFYINGKGENPSREIAYLLKKFILHHTGKWSEIVFLCIGSDRATGDYLRPYVGWHLSQQNLPGVSVYGTLSAPVHALNLEQSLKHIRKYHPKALVIAIDASLGAKKHLGYITIGNGSLYPGAGVQKALPPVGDIYITGIVNISGFLHPLTLQTTRLATVIDLAEIITGAILEIFSEDHTYPGCLVPCKVLTAE